MMRQYRVLDLTDRRGWLAGMLLAQLGAEVVLAEPAGGYRRDDCYAAYNRSKRSAVLRSAAEVAALAAAADVVLYCPPDALEQSLGICVDLDALRAADDTLITLALTPWGATGPKANWLADDLILAAACSGMAFTGDADRAPVRISVPQAWNHAAAEAAVACLIALYEREDSGRGQHVDLSAQQAVALTGMPAQLHAPAGLAPAQREAGGVRFGTQLLRWVYPCSDGFVVISIAFGPVIGPFTRRLFEWIHQCGGCDEATLQKDWVDLPLLIMRGEETLEELARLMDVIAAHAATRTKAELFHEGMARGLLIAPVSTLPEVLGSAQLEARQYWDEVEWEGQILRFPGPIAQPSLTPLRRLGAPPQTGADTDTIVAAWSQPSPHRPSEPAAVGSGTAGAAPLAGLKVCDLSWVAAAPLATRVLAHWGAEVVRVESVHRPCVLRGALGHRDDIPDQEQAITWHAVNAGKRTIALDLSVPEAREVVRDLVRWADVLVEAFTPGTLDRLGLSWEELHRLNPSLVMVSSCMMGQSGPLRDFAGFGNLAAAIAGFFDITGWPDRAPAGPYMAYTDYTSPRLTLCALFGALDHRRRTGEGQYIDFSQMEAATHFLAPALVELQRGGVAATRAGNVEADVVPHGVYPAVGHDDWVAISCRSDGQWRSLCVELRRPDLADLDGPARVARREELDALLASWTARQDGAGLAQRLQAHGVAAHRVQNTGASFEDAQLQWRNHYRWLDHPLARRVVVDGQPYTLSRSSGGATWAGPLYGEHATYVLGTLLGYDDEQVAQLAIAGALE